jgi:hypothetical protein
MISKSEKIKVIQQMRNDVINKLNFDELDQAETEFLSSSEFLASVSHKGLDDYIKLLESCETTEGSVKKEEYL